MSGFASILVLCDNSRHPRGQLTSVATFTHRDGEPWGYIGDTGATRPSRPGRPLRVFHILGQAGYSPGALRCKRCGEIVPTISLETLNNLAAQGVASRTIKQLRVLASK